MPTYISLLLNKKFTSAIFQFDVLYKSLKMHAVRFALQCFVEWLQKKYTELRKTTYYSSHTQTVFSSVHQNALYVSVHFL